MAMVCVCDGYGNGLFSQSVCIGNGYRDVVQVSMLTVGMGIECLSVYVGDWCGCELCGAWVNRFMGMECLFLKSVL